MATRDGLFKCEKVIKINVGDKVRIAPWHRDQSKYYTIDNILLDFRYGDGEHVVKSHHASHGIVKLPHVGYVPMEWLMIKGVDYDV